MLHQQTLRLFALVVAVFLSQAPNIAQADPQITNLSLRGLRIGGTTRLVITGTDLLPDPRIVMSIPIAGQVVQPSQNQNQIIVDVRVDPSATAGMHALRVATSRGISNGIVIGVDQLPQQPFVEQIESLPVALHGKLTGGQVLTTRFTGRKGMRVVVDVQSSRLGAKLKPVVRLLDSQGRQVAWSPAKPAIAGDARLEAELTADGVYSIRLHDLLYRGEAPGFFALKIGELKYADLVFPAGVQRGATVAMTALATNVDSSRAFEFTAVANDHRANLPALFQIDGFVGNQARVIVSDHPEEIEKAIVGDGLQELPAAPVAINGRLTEANQIDKFLLNVQPGTKLRFDVMARRLGSPLDGVLVIRGEKGNQLAQNDDRPGMPDPGLDFTVPKNETKLIVEISDLLKQGSAESVYRISVRDLSQPDFGLTLPTDRLAIPVGATQMIRVEVQRRGYNGPIKLSVEGLSDNIAVTGDDITAGATVSLLAFSARGTKIVHGLIRIIGTGGESDSPLQRIARTPATAVNNSLPWLSDDVGLAITQPSPIAIAWSTNESVSPLVGEEFPLHLTLTRDEKSQSKVRVRLLSTQVMPTKKIKENKKDKVVNDTDRALRLAGDPTFAPGAKDLTVSLLVPADLPTLPWGLALRAELLSADEKTVLAATTTSVRYLTPRAPFTIQLTGAAVIEARAGEGPTGVLSGKIQRVAGLAKTLTVTLTGLPKEYVPPKIEVAGTATEFEFPVRFPYGTKLAELKTAKLTASAKSTFSKTNVLVRGNEVAIDLIKVVAGERPPVMNPYEIFEDDERFVAYLSKGEGAISLETSDKYSGKSSVKVTPDQRYHDVVPNLDLKIRENPRPGEFRYLRFAWKKKGGRSVCLQISHAGSWGPAANGQDGSGKAGATFRYHAGTGEECFGASVKLTDKLPVEFVVVTRDLFADFGEFTFSGIALSPLDGEFALFDHIYLGHSPDDFSKVKP